MTALDLKSRLGTSGMRIHGIIMHMSLSAPLSSVIGLQLEGLSGALQPDLSLLHDLASLRTCLYHDGFGFCKSWILQKLMYLPLAADDAGAGRAVSQAVCNDSQAG